MSGIKGMKQSQEHIRKRVESFRRNGHHIFSEEHKRRISESKKGQNTKEKHWYWKGDSVGYMGLHSWIFRHFTKPKECENCGTKQSPQFNWATIHGTFSRDRKSWKYLCRKCHIHYDQTWVNRNRDLLGRFTT